MIPYLPPELIRQIIESSVPSSVQALPYRERQMTLLHLCRVSHLFREIAQPLLREMVSISIKKMMINVPHCAISMGWNQTVRQVAVYNSLKHDLGPHLKYLASVFPNVSSLVILDDNTSGLDLSVLGLFSNLQTCHLDSRKFPCGRTEVQSSTLTSLTLMAEDDPFEWANIFSAYSFPSLEILAFPYISAYGLLRLFRRRSPSSSSLLDQPHAFLLPAEVLSLDLVDHVKPFFHKTLVDFDTLPATYYQCLSLHVQHIRIRQEDLGLIVRQVEKGNKLPLRSIYLVKCGPRATPSLERNIAACEKKSIEVLIEAVPEDWNFETGISEEFVRRQRERRRLEAEQTALGVKGTGDWVKKVKGR